MAEPAAEAAVSRWWRAVPGLTLLVGLFVLSAGWGTGVDQGLRDIRDGLRSRETSGSIVLVDIDARSLQALDQWPWPRRYHAALVDRLATANAAQILFDVNFEAASQNPEDDALFADALKRANGLVVLPTFRQNADANSLEEIETLPHKLFRDHVFLGSVNVEADADGMVRRLRAATQTEDFPRPSMASLLAEANGSLDEVVEIDYSIDPFTIPRLSFVDVLRGEFDAGKVAGKKIFIGGTAADMQDRYTVPRHGVLPGVVVQALAAETILAGGMPRSLHGLWPLLLAFCTVLVAAWPGRPLRSALVLALGLGLLIGLPLATEHWLAMTFPVAPALVGMFAAALGIATLAIGDRHRRRSLVDSDTGLPNLRALAAVLPLRSQAAVVVAHLDRFTALAATLGPAGTAALVQRVAERLAAESGETVYRTDEHSLAWVQVSDPIAVDDLLRRITSAMRAPVDCGRRVDVTVGLGVADPGADSGGKQQVANAALAAERALRDRRPYLHYADARDEETGWHLSLLSELGAAMEAGEVWNAYQPKLDLRTNRICGVETLVRWTHRERGFVGPDRFIPVVEAAGRAAELTAHVIGRALADAARWHAAGHDLSVAVNVSATLLDDRAFIAWIGETLRTSQVPAAALTIEVTESAAMTDVEQAIAALTHWRSLGVVVSIDDYGTGQSSLGYLQRLPAGELKIDKSFIQNITDDNRDAIMVRSTVALAHQLGMKVVAEGVEGEATLALLRELECDVAQGYLIAKPMTADALDAFLGEPSRLAA